MDESYAQTVRLLLRAAPDVFANDIFAMKGGTAINLFVRDMPRRACCSDLSGITFGSFSDFVMFTAPGVTGSRFGYRAAPVRECTWACGPPKRTKARATGVVESTTWIAPSTERVQKP